MMRSLFAGVSGLRNHQVRMDVIGNNVANVNTVAFKSGRVTFKEGFAQLLQGASRPPGDHGGINPIQVGLGMQVGSIDTLFTQGNIETTGIATDLAIQGNSFFVVSKGNEHYYTRSGNFQLDADGRLVSPTNGFVVQGRMAIDGELVDGITDIRLPFGQKTRAQATTNVSLGGNLNSSAPIFTGDITNAEDRNRQGNAWTSSSIGVFDSLGNKHELKVYFFKAADNEWQMHVDSSAIGDNVNVTLEPANVLRFDPQTGTLDSPGPNDQPLRIRFNPPGGAAELNIRLNLGDTATGISQFATSSTAVLRDQDGHTMGLLQNFGIDRTGLITGAFSNGTTQVLGQIVLADFNNPSGLLRVGDNMYAVSGNSGSAVLGFALEGSQSFMTSGALEMSNVDLAQEFTSMIVAQRGFQANGRVITNSDEMLQEVVNLKR